MRDDREGYFSVMPLDTSVLQFVRAALALSVMFHPVVFIRIDLRLTPVLIVIVLCDALSHPPSMLHL